MPYYKPIKNMTVSERKRTVKGLQRIRKQLIDENFPNKKTTDSLILGTWNIRDFDNDKFNYGPRTEESMYYIAEIISRFDVLAVQEVCENLWPLKNLIKKLGRSYDYIVSDVTHSSLGGNKERLGFIYDKSKVRFTGVTGEIVLPDKLLISEVDEKKRQFSRTPFGVEFQSGWFKFYFATVHIYFGSNSPSSEKYKRRVKEIDAVAKYLSKEANGVQPNQILVGDFNIKAHGSPGFNALEKHGFTVVKNIKGSNKDRTKFYDQISFQSKEDELQLLEPEREDRVIQFFNSVYREKDFRSYKSVMTRMIKEKLKEARENLAKATTQRDKNKYKNTIEGLIEATSSEDSFIKYYNKWKTFQVSDHLPLWVEIKIDFSNEYLDYLKTWKSTS